MRGIRENTHCARCKKELDREGDLCKKCLLRSAVKTRQKVNRDNRNKSILLKQMKKSVYNQMLKEVNAELDEEEKGK